MAQAGLVGLLVDWGSRDPLPDGQDAHVQWRERITGYPFWKLVLGDVQAAVDHLQDQAFVRDMEVGLVGFCGGGKQALLFATVSKDVKAVVALMHRSTHVLNRGGLGVRSPVHVLGSSRERAGRPTRPAVE